MNKKDKMQIKLPAIFAFILLIMAILIAKIVYVMAAKGEEYSRQILSHRNYSSLEIPYQRGSITDSNGTILARSQRVYNCILDCALINTITDEANQTKGYVEPTIKVLVEAFDLNESEIRSVLTDSETSESHYYILKKQCSEEEKKAFDALCSTDDLNLKITEDLARKRERENIQGVTMEIDYVREYPLNALASSVIGFMGYSENTEGEATVYSGVTGLESYYEEILCGTNGRTYRYLNENLENAQNIVEPENGATLVTTLDANVQKIVEEKIAEFDTEYGNGPNESTKGHAAKNIGVIVADPNTGAVLAMASNRSVDLNDYSDISSWYSETQLAALSETDRAAAYNSMWSNYCISENYEPGSVVKPITVSAALESGSIHTSDTYVCDGGEFVVDTQINCDNIYGHGEETVEYALVNSCNDALMQIAAAMGTDTFCYYQSLFGFGKTTGIDLPNEFAGSLYNTSTMHDVELATNSFGQGFTCTMIQEMAAFCSVVNGGYYYQPYLVKQVLKSDGSVLKNMEKTVRNQPISETTSSLLRTWLETAVREGTGKKAQVPGYRIGGKTGTAEKFPRNEGNYLVSFIGAAPIDNPQLVIYVVVDEPNVSDEADSTYAQTLFRRIATEILPQQNIYPTETVSTELLAYLGIKEDGTEEGTTTVSNIATANQEAVSETNTETDATSTTDVSDHADNHNVPEPPKQTETTGRNDGSVSRQDLFGTSLIQ